jgi:hypothetical protein
LKVACLFKGRRSIETFKEKESGIENLAINLYIFRPLLIPNPIAMKLVLLHLNWYQTPHSRTRK